MDLSVVIVNWNSGDSLRRLQASLLPLQPLLSEVLIADNASGDASCEGLEAADKTTVLNFNGNRGFAGAANAAIDRSRSEFVLLLNPDVEILRSSVEGLYQRIVDEPDAAIVCGPLMSSDGRPQSGFQIRPLPKASSVFIDALFLDHLARPLRVKSQGAPNEVEEIEQPAAAYWMLRKKAWEQLGGFDEQFHPAWFEDVDFCRRLRDTDWKILYDPKFPAVHQGGASVDHLGRRIFHQIYYANLLRYLKKHHPFSYPILWAPVKLGSWIRQTLASS